MPDKHQNVACERKRAESKAPASARVIRQTSPRIGVDRAEQCLQASKRPDDKYACAQILKIFGAKPSQSFSPVPSQNERHQHNPVLRLSARNSAAFRQKLTFQPIRDTPFGTAHTARRTRQTPALESHDPPTERAEAERNPPQPSPPHAVSTDGNRSADDLPEQQQGRVLQVVFLQDELNETSSPCGQARSPRYRTASRQVRRPLHHLVRWGENKLRFRIDKFFDQPRTRDSVHFYVFTSNPFSSVHFSNCR